MSGSRPLKLPRNTLQIVQGRYVSELVWMLHSTGAMERLANWRMPGELANIHSWNTDLLTTILAFLHKTTDLFEKDSRGRYRVKSMYRSYARSGFYLDFFIGAYGKAVSRSADTLMLGLHESGSPDAAALARAFAGTADNGGEAAAVQVVRSLGISRLLDLGSGPGILLGTLAREDRNFLGWGIDQSAAMCRTARARFRDAGVDRRVKVIRGDVREVSRLLAAKQQRQIESVHAGGLLNSFFQSGAAPVVAFLRRLVRLFPGRVLLVDDYYSKVRDPEAAWEDYQLSILHDITQVFSGQGLPPQCLSEWERIYRSAGVKMIRSFQGNLRGLAWFHHVVQM